MHITQLLNAITELLRAHARLANERADMVKTSEWSRGYEECMDDLVSADASWDTDCE